MKYLSHIILITFSFSIFGQPTITNSVIPFVGSASTYRIFDAVNTMPGDSGANVTWDYSDLTATGTAIFDYKDPATMPAGTTYPSANLGVDQSGDPQIYLLKDNQQYSAVGILFSGITEDYTNNPKELLRFPITYADQYTDSFEGTTTVGTITANRNGNITIVGDGYGDLLLPYATFQNVLRIRTVSIYNDNILGNTVNSGIDTVYTWYQEGVKDYIITWNHISSTVAGEIFYGAFLDTMFVGVNELHGKSFKVNVAPNPATDHINISYRTNSEESINAQIFDSSGKLVKQIVLQGSSTFYTRTISIADLHRGLYLFLINEERNVYKTKIILE